MPYIEVPVTWVYKSPSVIPICNSIPRFSNISQFLYKKKCLFILWLCVTWIGLTVCRLRLFFFSLAASWFFLQYYDARQSARLYVLALWLLSTVDTLPPLPSINRCTCTCNNEFWPWFKIDPEVIFNVEYYDEWCFGFNFQRRKKKQLSRFNKYSTSNNEPCVKFQSAGSKFFVTPEQITTLCFYLWFSATVALVCGSWDVWSMVVGLFS